MSIYEVSLEYYIYAYLRKDGTPYYIGKGKGKRAWSSNRTFKPPKDKNRIVIMESNLTNIGALALERRIIRWYGRRDIGTGILRNKTDGGDGVCGASPELRKCNSEWHRGRTLSEETKRKISLSNKGRQKSPKHKEKIKQSMIEKVKSGLHNSKRDFLNSKNIITVAKEKLTNVKKFN